MLAKIRSTEWGTEEQWKQRISGYLRQELHPQNALLPRVIFVAAVSDVIIGFIAGHLTRRFECDGELQWINVVAEYRRRGIAFELLGLLARWFVEQKARKVCVDPGNEAARHFYLKKGAETLNDHWLVWKDIAVILKD